MAISFDRNFYLEQKLAQLQAAGNTEYTTTADVLAAFQEAGLTAQAHYEMWGAGEGLNPSAEFDTQAYLEAKLAQLQEAGYSEYSTTEQVLAAFQEAGLSPLEHYNQYGIDEGIEAVPAGQSTAGLTAALASLAAANEGLTSFLESAAENEAVAAEIAVEDPTSAQIDTALDDALTTTTNAVDDLLVSISGITDDAFVNAGANTKAGLIADGREDAQNAIETAQTALSDYQAEIAKVDGLASAISAAEAAEESLTAAQNSLTEAQDAYAGVEATFEAQNEAADGDLTTSADVVLQKSDGAGGFVAWDPATDTVADLARVQDTGNSQTLFTVNADGELVAESGLSAYTGLSTLQSSIQAVINAQATVEAAEQADTAAQNDLAAITDLSAGDFTTETNGQDVYTQLNTLEQNLTAVQEQQQNLEEAISTWQGVVELDSQRTDLEDAITDAEQAIEGEEGLNVTLRDGAENFASEDEVYLFNADEGNQSLSGFGASGQDRIYFGEEFTFTQIPEGSDISDNVGSVNALEIFWEQDGANLNLYVEEETFAGNSSAGAAADITTITLTGVNAEDVSFTNGYLTAGEVA
ncbi:hypothetical protein MHM84_11765 [Halomonas sp. McH1-25]|uniref:hypothetical protein n=1 Tax=unclassified Halomonas TaxID=2609666 RepID=UPI001EF58A2D|nr:MULTISPECIES: hypothetical protein [unclassified Halomonas]MCG7600467.1 hypothetical protein [Halomonas sp. McH1-25]MCP1342934.1 hypothetical protein [Halomonas sp. FL8]MCP1359974.1 hypothetical protein [Halomonas sp. BBD45]MCP1363902.1 hypothetical protein [Halomonas sp. BBD48]